MSGLSPNGIIDSSNHGLTRLFAGGGKLYKETASGIYSLAYATPNSAWVQYHGQPIPESRVTVNNRAFYSCANGDVYRGNPGVQDVETGADDITSDGQYLFWATSGYSIRWRRDDKANGEPDAAGLSGNDTIDAPGINPGFKRLLAGGGILFKENGSGVHYLNYEKPGASWRYLCNPLYDYWPGWCANRKGLYVWNTSGRVCRFDQDSNGNMPNEAPYYDDLMTPVYSAATDGGYLFYADRQGGIRWAKDYDSPTPPVYESDELDEAPHLSSQETELSRLRAKLAMQESELATLRQEPGNIPAPEVEPRQTEEDGTEERRRTARLENDLETARQQDNEDHEKIASLEEQIRMMQQNTSNSVNVAALERELARAKGDERVDYSALTDLNARLDEALRFNTTMGSSIASLNKQLDAKRAEIERLTRALQNCQSQAGSGQHQPHLSGAPGMQQPNNSPGTTHPRGAAGMQQQANPSGMPYPAGTGAWHQQICPHGIPHLVLPGGTPQGPGSFGIQQPAVAGHMTPPPGIGMQQAAGPQAYPSLVVDGVGTSIKVYITP